jgi:hypothetical protein
MESANLDAFIDFLIDNVLFPELKEGEADDSGSRTRNTNQPTSLTLSLHKRMVRITKHRAAHINVQQTRSKKTYSSAYRKRTARSRSSKIR